MLKILVYDTNFVPGISRVIPVIKIKYWQKHDCQITIFGTKDAEFFYKSKLGGLNYLSLDFKYKVKNPYSLIWEVIKVNFLAILKIKEVFGKYDIVYSQSSVIDFLFVPWVLKNLDKRIKWFVMVDNIVPGPGERPGAYLKNLIPYLAFKLGDWLLKKADGIFVVTDFLKNYYQKNGMKNVIKTNNGYGIETEIFTGKINKKAPKFDALYCGRLHLAKGIMDLVEVARIVTQKNPNFTIGILGDGDEKTKNNFFGKIKEYNLDKNFLFFGYKTGRGKGDIYRNCGFFLFLSYDEGCPHAVIEAFACNKLVLAYDLPIYHEVFNNYLKSGQLVLFRQKDLKAIADFILKREKKKNLFHNSLKDFTWDRIVKKELEVMRAV
ncbi:MAG: glycosyltransferase [Patescibacteria group bacterium]|nr:glycosyltransferase [Patescibacteria group bacterium]